MTVRSNIRQMTLPTLLPVLLPRAKSKRTALFSVQDIISRTVDALRQGGKGSFRGRWDELTTPRALEPISSIKQRLIQHCTTKRTTEKRSKVPQGVLSVWGGPK